MSGPSIILTALEGMTIEYALRFAFLATKNEAEYEALIVDLKLDKELNILKLRFFSDSQLVVGQVKEEFEAQSPSMAKYLERQRRLKHKFQTMKSNKSWGLRLPKLIDSPG